MTLAATDSPVRIGLIGLGPCGAYHLERIGLRSDLRVVAACAAAAERGRTPLLGDAAVPRVADLLARDDLDYVLIAAPQEARAELAVRALDKGFNVAVESPPCVSGEQAQLMLAAARHPTRRPGQSLCALPSRRDAFDFRAALQSVSGGSLGTIEAARIVAWAKAIPAEIAEAARQAAQPEIQPGDGVFSFFAYQYVDQLLQLVGRRPQTVFARISHPPAADPTATAFFVSIDFEGGGDGLIDVNLHAGAALQTGWMLVGTTGAYCQQRIHLTEPSGEVVDTPIAPADVPEIDIYAGLLDTGRADQCRLESFRQAATVMQVIDAARDSSRTKQAVTLLEAVG
jgi:predicted dehydrogenase